MSPSIIDIFATDARKHVARLRSEVEVDGRPNVDNLRRACRRLHHSAVLANHEPVIHASAALQKTAVQLMAGKRAWSDELGETIRNTVRTLDQVIEALPAGDPAAESSLQAAAAELIPGDGARTSVARNGAEEGSPSVSRSADGGEADTLLRAVITDLGEAVERLENDPRDREPLKLMLRKIRRLRELGRIEVLSPPDRALGAVEELILNIADLNATVGPGYLTVFSHARDVLEELQAGEESMPSVDQVGGRAVEVDRLKDQVMQKVRLARQVIWVSDLFYPEGPHIVACPIAAPQGGPESYFLGEARQRLERSENLRQTMLEANTEQMRLAGEALSQTLRHLRERAAAFDHGELGRLTRRAAAALRAQLVRPPARIRAMARGFGDVFSALKSYLESEDELTRARAVADADAALHHAILGDEPELAPEDVPLEADSALQRALALRARMDERLQHLDGPDAQSLRHDLEELFDLIAHYVSATAEPH